jgi:putative DNA primase/helicase
MNTLSTEPNPFLTAALAYAAIGRAVFPVAPGAKAPPLTLHGCKDASTDPEQIRAWWAANPTANVAIATGAPSGISVLDVDDKAWTTPPKHGSDTLLALVAEHGALPTTLTQRTWSGGLQLLFAYEPTAAHGTNSYGADLDGRNDGGYVVVAPSHVIDGTREGTYAWLSDPRETALAPMPQWLLDRAAAKAGPRWRSVPSQAMRAAEDLKAGRARNNALTSMAGTLRRVGFTEEAILEALAAQNAASPYPLDAHEVETIARSVARYEPTDAPEDDPGGERYTDVTNAVRLAELAGGRVAHVGEMKDKWYTFQGGRLVLDFPTCLYPFTNAVAHAIFLEAKAEQARADAMRVQLETATGADAEAAAMAETLKARFHDHAARAKMLLNGGRHLESTHGARGCIEMAKAEPALRLTLDRLDAHPTWLNTPTGTVDLETGAVWPHRFTDYLTKVTGAGYDPAATCPRWLAFLEDVLPDPAVRAFMQRAIGYALTDLTHEQCLWFLYGKGRNGKSTFLNAIRGVLGEYGASTKASTLMIKQHGDERRNDVAVLRGARFVSATEAEDGQRMAESLIKEVTGEDPITARLMYAEFFTFRPTFKIFLAANHKPIVHGTDLAIWRRIHLVPFTQTIPAERINPRLAEALAAEASGILNWAIEGYQAWRAGGLQPPKAVTDATAEYRAEMDPLADFLEDGCFTGPTLDCTKEALYAHYERWAVRNGIRFPLKAQRLGVELLERGFKDHRGTGGVRSWRGIKPRVV